MFKISFIYSSFSYIFIYHSPNNLFRKHGVSSRDSGIESPGRIYKGRVKKKPISCGLVRKRGGRGSTLCPQTILTLMFKENSYIDI